jgi:hypothetical protein
MQVAADQVELTGWLAHYPTLQQAHSVIRSHQNPDYMRRVDQFGKRCLAQFHHAVAVDALFGGDLVVGIDMLFESLQSIEAVPQLFRQLPVPATPDDASADALYLSQYLVQHPLDLLTAVRLELAELMVIGHNQLSAFDPALADYWFKVYHHTILTYLRQQADQTSLALSQHTPCLSASFEWAVRHYSTRFDETGALPMYVMGVVSFSPYASQNFLDTLVETLPPLSQLLRLAQDVVYDPKEVLNTGIFAHASENSLTLAQAVQELQESPDLQETVSCRLSECYYDLLQQTRQFTETTAAICHDNGWLTAFSQDILNTSRDMTRKWKPS